MLTLKHWLDAANHFEHGIIYESTFLRAQAGAIDTASRLKPTTTSDAVTMLTFITILWKEEIHTPTTPAQIAMEKMLENLMDFFGNTKLVCLK